MSSQWFYTKGRGPIGPISDIVLKQLADAGGLNRTDQILEEGTTHWMPAESLPGLFHSPTPVVKSPRSLTPDKNLGKLDVPGFDRFLCTPSGYLKMLLGGFFVMFFLAFFGSYGSSNRDPTIKSVSFLLVFWAILDGFWFFIITFAWSLSYGETVKKTTCPRCKSKLSMLLMEKDLVVLDSEEQIREYTTYQPIRDSSFRVVGYYDEHKSRNVTVNQVLTVKKVRCKGCGFDQMTNDIGQVIT